MAVDALKQHLVRTHDGHELPPEEELSSLLRTKSDLVMIEPRRVLFDTTVLWGAFHSPNGPNAKLWTRGQRAPVLDGFITDAVGAEFWWRATQQGVTGTGQRVPRTYGDESSLRSWRHTNRCSSRKL